jgi:3-deoxy-manno-octulosonate cytidylyltransferase (CMP-KDO synthetase)
MGLKASHPTPPRPVVCGVIPARMQSHRLPGKPLRLICSRPLIHWVYERCRASSLLNRLVVATDSDEIRAYSDRHHFPVVMTSAQHASGTDRLTEVMELDSAAGRLADVYVNIQGDEPMITPRHIELLLEPFSRPRTASQNDSGLTSAHVSTLKVAIAAEEAADPSVTKVVTDSRGYALYFSHAPIPHRRDGPSPSGYFKHLGLYAYTPAALRRFHSLPPSPLELAERLEQLRFLENGIPISVLETHDATIGVDTEDDLRRVERNFESQGIAASV